MAEADDRRPSPDAFLGLAARERRGRLKVFLGASPGVGKTYAMLAGAQRLRAEGKDVVVGVVETHGRAETDALLAGLELLPRRRHDYRGHVLEEFDIDAALARKPALIIVDELAHSNPPDARHPKRYQDVEELIAAGISVWTAINIQHIESLSDVVSAITGIKVREVVPDTVLEKADDVVLVDLTPDELAQRLREGKVYLPETAQRAAENFLQPGNFTALRELALRRTAQRIDDEMVDYLRQRAIEGPWPSAERIMVCVGAQPRSEFVVRTAARMANGLNASWLAVHLSRPAESAGPDQMKRIDDSLALAQRLGADVARHTALDLVDEALRLARRENITQIVIGRGQPSWLKLLLGRSLPDALLRRAHGLAIHVVTDDDKPGPVRRRWPLFKHRDALAATLSVAVAVLVSAVLERLIALSNFAMVFLAAVLFCAVRLGTGSAIIASVLSFLAYNFFFIMPRYTFTIASPQELLSLIVFLLVAVFTGSLAGRVRVESLTALARVKQIQTLLDFSSKLSATVKPDDVLWVVVAKLAEAVRGQSMVLIAKPDKELEIVAAMPPDDQLGTADWAAARWAVDHSEAAGWKTDTLPGAEFLFLPLRSPGGVIGAAGIRPASGALSDDDRRIVDALVDQASVALQRTRLLAEAADARSAAETEKLRAALLSSVSHDLRTPLSSIVGSASALRSLGDRMPASDRDDLLANIEEEAARLSRFVGDLLDMTKLESGISVRHDRVDAAEIAAAVLRRAREIWPDREITGRYDEAPAIVVGDAGLADQLLFNIVENAARYAPESPILLTVGKSLDRVTITVEDWGPGIPVGDLERVFDKFYRVKEGDGRPPGTGLGLAICRAIATALGGAIHAESPIVGGKGTRMVISLPARPA